MHGRASRWLANGLVGASLAVCLSAAAVVRGLVAPDVPYAEPEELVEIWESHPTYGSLLEVSHGSYAWWREKSRNLAAVAHFQWLPATRLLEFEDRRLPITLAATTPGFLDLLGVPLIAGRPPAPDERDAEADVIVLSQRLLEPLDVGFEILGRDVRLDGRPFRVVGITPRELELPGRAGAYTFFVVPDDMGRRQRNQRYLKVVGRLAPGATVAGLQSELEGLSRDLGSQVPEVHGGWHPVVRPLIARGVGPLWWPALLVALSSGATYLLGLVGLAGVLMAETAARGRDWQVRIALGATPSRVVAEQCVVASGFVVPGALLAAFVAGVLVARLPALVPFSEGAHPRIDSSVLALWLILSVTALGLSVLSMAAPLRWRDPARGLLDGGNVGGRGAIRAVSALRWVAVVQIVGAVPLLHLAVGLQGSLQRLAASPLGFEPGDKVTADLPVPAAQRQETLFADATVDRLRAGGVDAVLASSAPLRWPEVLWFVSADNANRTWTAVVDAMPGYPERLSIPLLAGRTFSVEDRRGARPVAMVSALLARTLWGDIGVAVGRRLRQELDVEREVVGVLADVEASARGGPGVPALYVPLAQGRGGLLQVILAEKDLPTATAVLRETGPGLALQSPIRLRDLASERLAALRLAAGVAGALAVAAAALALVGVSGVAKLVATSGTREFALKVALGATAEGLLRNLVWRLGGWMALGALGGMTLSAAVAVLQPAFTGSESAGAGWTVAIGLALPAVALTVGSLQLASIRGVAPAELLRRP